MKSQYNSEPVLALVGVLAAIPQKTKGHPPLVAADVSLRLHVAGSFFQRRALPDRSA